MTGAARSGAPTRLVWIALLGVLLGTAVRPAAASAQRRDSVAVPPVSTRTAPGDRGGAIDRARALLAARMPVTASRLLARELSLGAVQGSDAVLLAATAYIEQRAWDAARRLLVGREWSSPAAASAAKLLLGQAYAGLDSADSAIRTYQAYLADAPPPVGARVRVELARALQRAGRPADAAEQLSLGEAENGEIAGWLRLTRFQVLAASGDTSALGLVPSLLSDPVVPTDSVFLEAARLAFETARPDRAMAFARRADPAVWRGLSEEYIAPHLLAAGDTGGAVEALRSALSQGRAEGGTGPTLLGLDGSWRTQVLVGRSDLRSGRAARAVRLLEIALERAPPAEQPGIAETLARAHGSLGQHSRAIEVLGLWRGRREATDVERSSLWLLAAQTFAALGDSTSSADAYGEAARGSGNSAALAAYLIADTHHDAERLDQARAAYERSFDRFPESSYGSRSLERLALLDFREGRYGEARVHLRAYRQRYRRGEWYQGAIYWTGRTHEAEGDSASARNLYVETIGHDPLDYYAILAASRIAEDRWAILRLGVAPPLPALAAVHAGTLARMNLLRDLGWPNRARREWRRSRDEGPDDPDQVLAYAHALNADGWTQEGVAEGWRAKAKRVGWSRPLLEAIYPLPFSGALADAARLRGLDARFVAGLARRESLFDPEIVSSANAVGLMQLLPQTARDVAPRAGLPEYRRSQLTVPQVNLLLGTQYLADMLERFDGDPIAGLISYNAGPHRFVRWREFPEFADPEARGERIPFRETREYVRAVTELAEIYRFLYPDLGVAVP